MEERLQEIIEKIQSARENGAFKNYVEYIRFPFYKNLAIDSKINFDFPFTVLVGQNGSGKSSALHGIFGMPEGSSTGNFWFSTSVDPIVDDTNNRHCFIYAYIGSDGKIKEVVKTRIGTAKGSNYWEPSRPIKRYGMEKMAGGGRNPTIVKKVVYLDFRSELSAYDKFFYFSNFIGTKTIKTKQESIRLKSRHLIRAIETDSEQTFFSRKIQKPKTLPKEQLFEVNKILGKNYIECKLINHNLYSEVEGLTIYFKTDHIKYSEAFAGRGEFAVVRMVNEIMELKEQDYPLVILDEPEVSLHPGAQRKLLEFLLKQTLEKKLQMVLSTHSPHFVENLPDNALKLFYPSDNIRFDIKNSCHFLEAFHNIGQEISSSHKKGIYVEDYLAKQILDTVIADLRSEYELIFEVYYFPGGATDLMSRASSYAQENEKLRFIILDGDKRKDKVNPDKLSVEESRDLDFLGQKIKDITGLGMKALRFSIDSLGDAGNGEQKIQLCLRYLKYLFSNMEYLPGNGIPEDMIWNESHAQQLLAVQQKDNIDFHGDSKQKLKTFTEAFVGSMTEATYRTCCKIFVDEFVRAKNDQYRLITGIIEQFKAVT